MATIIFDLDDTLYDTTRFKKDIEAVLVSHGIAAIDVRESYQKIKSSGEHTFEEHLQELTKKYRGFEPSLVLPKLLALFEREYIFPGVRETLKKLKDSHSLIMLTRGAEQIQRLKIESAGIKKYFDSIYITEQEKEELLKNLKISGKIYFVNDKIDENKKVRKHFPHFTVMETQNGEPVIIPDSPSD